MDSRSDGGARRRTSSWLPDGRRVPEQLWNGAARPSEHAARRGFEDEHLAMIGHDDDAPARHLSACDLRAGGYAGWLAAAA